MDNNYTYFVPNLEVSPEKVDLGAIAEHIQSFYDQGNTIDTFNTYGDYTGGDKDKERRYIKEAVVALTGKPVKTWNDLTILDYDNMVDSIVDDIILDHNRGEDDESND